MSPTAVRSHRTVRTLLPLLALVIAAAGPACAEDTKPAAAPAATAKAPAAQAVAEVQGAPITATELLESLGRTNQQAQPMIDQPLQTLIEERLFALEAKARGMEVEALVRQEIDSKVGTVSDADVDAWYEANKARIGNRPKDQVTPQIKNYLQNVERPGNLRAAFVDGLRKKYTVRILLEPPRTAIDIADAPTKGPANAAVTIVEFSDFECPYCSRVVPTLKEVEKKYGDKVRFAFIQYPLPIHPKAPKAAEAALCAHEQGKFWQMHDAMFAAQEKLEIADLKAAAVGLGMDASKFDGCLDSGKFAARVQNEIAAGQKAGVSGTPATFINGRLVSGAAPLEQFTAIIEDELARHGGGAN